MLRLAGQVHHNFLRLLACLGGNQISSNSLFDSQIKIESSSSHPPSGRFSKLLLQCNFQMCPRNEANFLIHVSPALTCDFLFLYSRSILRLFFVRSMQKNLNCVGPLGVFFIPSQGFKEAPFDFVCSMFTSSMSHPSSSQNFATNAVKSSLEQDVTLDVSSVLRVVVFSVALSS